CIHSKAHFLCVKSLVNMANLLLAQYKRQLVS
ncbi:hypothetical protein, partial [uncultured Gammaproteobacteria bacterium]